MIGDEMTSESMTIANCSFTCEAVHFENRSEPVPFSRKLTARFPRSSEPTLALSS